MAINKNCPRLAEKGIHMYSTGVQVWNDNGNLPVVTITSQGIIDTCTDECTEAICFFEPELAQNRMNKKGGD